MTQFTITELSNNKDYKRIGSDPQISGKNVVWRIANPNENKIFLYDGNKTIEISSTNGTYPRISGDNIVWYGSDSEGNIEIFFYNGQETIQLTDNNVDEINPQISGDNIVWCTDTTSDMNVYLYNGQNVIKINEGNLANDFPEISRDNVVWTSIDPNGNEQIFLYNGEETIQLSGNKHQYILDFQVSGDNVVWSDQDFNGNRQIFLYNGEETIQLSGNNNVKNLPSPLEGKKLIEKSKSSHGNEIFLDNIHRKETILLTEFVSPILYDFIAYYEPRIYRISGDNVVWRSERGVFLYNGKKNIKLDDNVNISSVEMQGNNLVWTQTNFFDSQDDWEIFFYDGKETIQLTNNNLNDFSPQISGDNIVWQGDNGFNSEIFLYDGNEVIQLTDNNVYDLSPEIEGNRIVWERLNLEQDVPTTSVMMATLDETQASSLPAHPKQQIINSSMVITLGLISIYLLKKLLLK
jgi:beta propeller repeat protein